MPQDLVLPGDALATVEEFQPGPGTYEEDGTVYAARIGVAELDTNEFIVRVRPVTKFPITLQKGDIVLGNVAATRTSMAIVHVSTHVAYPERDLACDTNGTLHVSKMSEQYVDRVDETYRPGDLVRAQVIDTDPSLQLSTRGPRFGVLRRFCPRCRTEMAAKQGALVCPECDWKDLAKVAEDYGRGTLVPEEKA